MFFVTQPHRIARALRHFDPAFDPDAARVPALDVSEDEAAYTATLDMPGVSKESVKVRIDGRQVHVQTQIAQAEPATDGPRVVYRERRTPTYARSFSLPQELDQTSSQARFENGVLTLSLVKRQPVDGGNLTIN